MNQLTDRDIENFQKSIGVTTFSLICLSIHNTFGAVWHILISPFVDIFTCTPEERRQ
ncbi:MAG TPA: hypothetical protein VM577_05600 [Anaerovoracaceae bacterium]|nr:hypothetical protein [Anaerovoracaceae bacterium]